MKSVKLQSKSSETKATFTITHCRAVQCLTVNNKSMQLQYFENQHTAYASCRLIVGHVARRGTELGVGLDDLVDGLQEVLLRCHFAPRANCKHSRLSTDAADLGT